MRFVFRFAILALIALLTTEASADTRRSISKVKGFVTDRESVRALNEEIGAELKGLFGLIVPANLELRFVDEQQFRQLTGGVDFTAALYTSGIINIPAKVNGELIVTETDLRKTLRHELFHAAVDNISSGRCPLWLEEGLAQLFEGYSHLTRDTPPPSFPTEGEGGFYSFDEKTMRQRYRSSRIFAQELLFTFGTATVVSYLKELSRREEVAFSEFFGVNEAEFLARPVLSFRDNRPMMNSLEFVGALR